MSAEDYFGLIASMTRDAPRPLKWGEGGRAVLLGWVEAMRKAHGRTKRGQR